MSGQRSPVAGERRTCLPVSAELITDYPYLGPSTDRLPILPAHPSGGREPAANGEATAMPFAAGPLASPGWPAHSPGGQPGEAQPTAGVGEPRLPAPAVFHPLAADRATAGGGGVPLASGSPSGAAERDGAAAGDDGPSAAASPVLSGWIPTRIYPEVIDTAVAVPHFPELAPLQGWHWWWVADTLIGRHTDAAGAAMLYVDTDHAALTRTHSTGELHYHHRGDVAAIVAEAARTC